MPKTDYATVPVSLSQKAVSNDRQRLLTPIDSYCGYKALLDEILEYKEPEDSANLTSRISLCGYEDAPCELLGLVSYCGQGDKSNIINKWLSGRVIPSIFPDEQIANIIRVLEYSLNELDKRYGKYEGTVYRAGFFNPNTDRQFYSSSFSPFLAINHSKSPIPDGGHKFSIIKVKNGHNIYEFQNLANTRISRRYARSEKEILIDRHSKFRLIPEVEYTVDNMDSKIGFIALCIGTTRESVNRMIQDEPDLPAWKNVYIWEEV